MKSFARPTLLCLTLAHATWSHATAPDPALAGCWRAVKIVVQMQDGAKVQDASGRCMLRFTEDQFESSCATTTGQRVTNTYRYQVVRPNFFSASIAGSTTRTDLTASTREYEYHVDGDRLVTVTHPQGKAPGASTGLARVESEATRIPCE